MTAASTQVTSLLTQFGLTTAAEEMVPRLTQAGHPEAMPVLVEVFEAEAEARRQRRITRLRRASRLPPGKTFATLDTGRFPAPVAQQLETLATGAFLETAANVLAFGLPGVGKSHALCAVGHALGRGRPQRALRPLLWRAGPARRGGPTWSDSGNPSAPTRSRLLKTPGMRRELGTPRPRRTVSGRSSSAGAWGSMSSNAPGVAGACSSLR